MNFLDPRLPDRFWDRCTPCPMSGCWLWIGTHDSFGYGHYVIASGKRRGDGKRDSNTVVRAHRATYEALRGPIPRDLEIDHLCRVRSCCNPAHLEAVTHTVNMQRSSCALATRKMFREMTHCRKGIHL